jgi:hypothetical protein
MTGRQGRVRGAVGAALLGCVIAGTAAAAGSPLRRDLASYVIFALRSAGLKNLTVTGACNVGVDCARPSANSECGVVTHEDPSYADGSQIAGDRARFSTGGGIIFQLFSNEPSGLDKVFIGSPPVEPLDLPILGDADGDGAASCGPGCTVDAGDLATACGFPTPFPACDPGQSLVVAALADCPVGDQAPGNQRCDLPPGVYGDLEVRDKGALMLTGGEYVVCDFTIGKNAEVLADAASVVQVSGSVRISNDSNFGPPAGQSCGAIRVNVDGPGSVTFGRQVAINGYFCAPQRTIQLGHDNDLTGRFFADTISGDSNNRAFCCHPDSLGSRCACLDSFAPTAASVGGRITLFSTCSLDAATEVRVCGLAAPIVAQTDDKIEATVPPGAAGACQVQLISPAGTFTAAGTLTVS